MSSDAGYYRVGLSGGKHSWLKGNKAATPAPGPGPAQTELPGWGLERGKLQNPVQQSRASWEGTRRAAGLKQPEQQRRRPARKTVLGGYSSVPLNLGLYWSVHVWREILWAEGDIPLKRNRPTISEADTGLGSLCSHRPDWGDLVIQKTGHRVLRRALRYFLVLLQTWGQSLKVNLKMIKLISRNLDTPRKKIQNSMKNTRKI